MDLTPLNAALHGYTPQPDMTDDRIPQMRALSTNACPNSDPMWLTMEPGTCAPGLTTWGYCMSCWDAGLVPASWAQRVNEATEVRPR
jgi:hypothetical protein